MHFWTLTQSSVEYNLTLSNAILSNLSYAFLSSLSYVSLTIRSYLMYTPKFKLLSHQIVYSHSNVFIGNIILPFPISYAILAILFHAIQDYMM